VKFFVGHHNITYLKIKYDLKIVIPILMTHFVTPTLLLKHTHDDNFDNNMFEIEASFHKFTKALVIKELFL
jgi:hypothetical protein